MPSQALRMRKKVKFKLKLKAADKKIKEGNVKSMCINEATCMQPRLGESNYITYSTC